MYNNIFCNISHAQDLSKSPKSVKKLLPKRKPERKQSEEEFALRKSMFTDILLSVKFKYTNYYCLGNLGLFAALLGNY